MLRSGIAFDVWLRQPERVIETAIGMYREQDGNDSDDGDPDGLHRSDGSWSG
jgi:hypothetical protein